MGRGLYPQPPRRGAADGDERPRRAGTAARQGRLAGGPRRAARECEADPGAPARAEPAGPRRGPLGRRSGGGGGGLARRGAGAGGCRAAGARADGAWRRLSAPGPGSSRPRARPRPARRRRCAACQGGGAGIRRDAADRCDGLRQDRGLSGSHRRMPAAGAAIPGAAAGDRAVGPMAGPVPAPLRRLIPGAGGDVPGVVAFRAFVAHPPRHLARHRGRGGAGGRRRAQRAVPALSRPWPDHRG